MIEMRIKQNKSNEIISTSKKCFKYLNMHRSIIILNELIITKTFFFIFSQLHNLL